MHKFSHPDPYRRASHLFSLTEGAGPADTPLSACLVWSSARLAAAMFPDGTKWCVYPVLFSLPLCALN